MNFIEAWIKANGKRITREVWMGHINTKEQKITDVCSRMVETDILANDWKVLKEENILWTVTFYNNIVNKYGSILFYSREEMEIWKKRHIDTVRTIGTEKYIDRV